MIYLLDANVLIDAARDYYPLTRVPEFWSWLVHHGNSGAVKIAVEIYEEVTRGRDEVATWLRRDPAKSALLLPDDIDPAIVAHVVDQGYAPDLNDDELEQVGRDPFLIAHALAGRPNACVVTTEGSRPGRRRANRHVPDVCGTLAIPTCDTFGLLRDLDFRTDWE